MLGSLFKHQSGFLRLWSFVSWSFSWLVLIKNETIICPLLPFADSCSFLWLTLAFTLSRLWNSVSWPAQYRWNLPDWTHLPSWIPPDYWAHFHWPCLRRSHSSPLWLKRLQSEQWTRAVMTSITRGKLDQTSGCLTRWCVDTHSDADIQVAMHRLTHRFTVQARSQPAYSHSCSPLSFLLLPFQPWKQHSRGKIVQNNGLGV